MRSKIHTFAPAMYIHWAVADIYIYYTTNGEKRLPEPVISDEISLQVAIRDVPSCIWIDVLLWKAKIDHVNGFFVWG
jgi:hypothetical protein